MAAGTVSDLGTLEVFLRGRLRTAGLVSAGLAAAACASAHHQMLKYPEFRGAGFAPEIPDGRGEPGGAGAGRAQGGWAGRGQGGGSVLADDWTRGARAESAGIVRGDFWAEIDAEADARTPSPAQREASRRQGRALLRAARVAWPEAPGLAALAASAQAANVNAPGRGADANAAVRDADVNASRLGIGNSGRSADRVTGGAWREYRGGPHHAVVLGAAAAAAGCAPDEAARVAVYQAVAGPVSAAVRLLALDPMRATAVLAGLASDIDAIAAQGAEHAGRPLDELPCPSAPALDLLAETHIRTEVRLFES